MAKISITSNAREDMLDITGQVGKFVPEGGDGVVVCFVQHTTCGLTVNENADPDVQSDMLGWLRRLVPQFPHSDVGESVSATIDEPLSDLDDIEYYPRPKSVDSGKRKSSAKFGSGPCLFEEPRGDFFKHAEHNSDAHIKSSLIGPSVTVPFADGKLLLGRWQGIYLCEFDGPRERKVVVTIVKSE